MQSLHPADDLIGPALRRVVQLIDTREASRFSYVYAGMLKHRLSTNPGSNPGPSTIFHGGTGAGTPFLG
jgi:hypothetical protein